jgi:hypothetical protein
VLPEEDVQAQRLKVVKRWKRKISREQQDLLHDVHGALNLLNE